MTRGGMAAKAAALFERFRGRAPRTGKDMFVIAPAPEMVAIEIGALVGVIYKKEGSKVPFCHRFKSTNRPVLASSFDGSQLYILAGGYELTARGIEG